MIPLRRQTLVVLLLCTLAAFLIPPPVEAQTISVGNGSGLPGASVDLAVSFAPGATPVSSLQFDLTFPSSLTYTRVNPGAAANAAGKSVSGAAVAGGMRVVVFGFNQSAIGSGIIAVVTLGISPGAAPAPVSVSIASVDASDPAGIRVPGVSGSGGTVTIIGSADTTPPVIGAVSASAITSTGATVFWTTNEPSNTQVEFGTTAAYGNSTPLVGGLVTSHSQSLAGLASSTLYHYRVLSRDGAGNLGTSADFTFTTAAPEDTAPPVITAIASSSVTGSGALITWTTNEASSSQVEYGLTSGYGSTSGLNTTMVTSHSLSLAGLAPATRYHYRVKSRDDAGNTAVSGDYTFTTSDTAAPTISGVTSSNITQSSATVSWTTNEPSNTQVEFGTTAAYGNSTPLVAALATSHSQSLTGLSPSALYHYRVLSRDGAGNLGTSADFTFTTAAPEDTAPPVITAIASSSVTGTGALITWTTNEASSSQVEYGLTSGYGSTSGLNTTMVTSHSQSLAGLAPATRYHYRVKSRDDAGNTAVSGDYTFTTSDTAAPTISGVTSSNITQSGALISWTTSEPSDSTVEYGTAMDYGSTAGSSLQGTSHSVALSGLKSTTQYHYRVKSRDTSGNQAVSGDQTFTTAGSDDTTAPVINNVSATAVTKTTALILWSTDESSDSQVDFGGTDSYGNATPLNTAAATSHAQLLSALTAARKYHYRVRSRDAAGNLAISGDYTFTTSSEPDTTPPVISAVTVSGVGYSRATVTWSTNEAADGQVEYGTVESYGLVTALRPTLLEAHTEVLRGLIPKTTYHFRVKSKDAEGNIAMSADLTFTTTEKPTGDAAATLFYPLMPGSGGVSQSGEVEEQYVGVAIANLDTAPATLTFTAYGPSGVEISGPSISNPVTRVLNPTEQLPVVDTQLFGDAIQSHGTIGWIKVESTVAKVAGFFLIFDSRMSVLDGANISSHPMTSFVLPEIEDRGFTRVDIANPSADPAELKFQLVRADGTTAASMTRTVPGSGAVVADLWTDLFPDSTPASSDYVRVSAPTGMLAFELLGKASRYVQGLNGQDSTAGSAILYSPQYAVGGPWRSALSVVNLDSTAGTVTFRFIHDDSTQIGATKVLPIEPHGKIRIDDPAFFQSLFVNPSNVVTQGYVEIISSGIRLTGSVVFGDPECGVFSAALPLVDQLQRSVLFSQVAVSQTYFTGIAILNPNTNNATATLDLYGTDGRIEASTVITIPGKQRTSMVLTEFFPGLAGQTRTSGYVKVTADKDIAAFALFGSNDLSVLSAIPPQIVP